EAVCRLHCQRGRRKRTTTARSIPTTVVGVIHAANDFVDGDLTVTVQIRSVAVAQGTGPKGNIHGGRPFIDGYLIISVTVPGTWTDLRTCRIDVEETGSVGVVVCTIRIVGPRRIENMISKGQPRVISVVDGAGVKHTIVGSHLVGCSSA